VHGAAGHVAGRLLQYVCERGGGSIIIIIIKQKDGGNGSMCTAAAP